MMTETSMGAARVSPVGQETRTVKPARWGGPGLSCRTRDQNSAAGTMGAARFSPVGQETRTVQLARWGRPASLLSDKRPD
ncbi:hypothetical protein BgiBS90_003102 [Biomphalaria glabrata]|nr:hypothetical protein BgiBS90_003102 [Biomphalaria glabrata]